MEPSENEGLPNDYDSNVDHSAGGNKKFAFIALIVVIVLVLSTVVMRFQTSKVDSAPQNAGSEENKSATVSDSFNNSDKDVTSNNNMMVAAERLKSESFDSLWSKGEQTTASQLTKSPYSSIGKIFRISGKVYKVEELPPSPDLHGKWGELLLLVENSNSPLGMTTIDYIVEGDISKINSGQFVTCVGYFIGTHESENAVGGKVEAIVLMGNGVADK